MVSPTKHLYFIYVFDYCCISHSLPLHTVFYNPKVVSPCSIGGIVNELYTN